MFRRASVALTVAILPLLAASAWALPAPGPADTRLADAAARRDVAAIRSLLSQKVDPNVPGRDGSPALLWMVRVDDVETAKLLVRAGADATKANRYGLTPLALAAANGSAPMLTVLLGAGADPNAVDPAGETALMAASRVGNLDAVRVLLEHNATIDARDAQYQETALMVAVRENHPQVVKLLMELGADVNAKTRVGITPPFILPNSVPGFGHGVGIVRGGSPDRGRRSPTPGGMSPLQYAARDGRLDEIKVLLDGGADVNQVEANDITPLITAIGNNHPEVATYLIDRGADVNKVDWYGRTALFTAVETRNMDVDNAPPFENSINRAPYLPLIQRLIDKGANVNARTKEQLPIRPQFLRVTGTLEWVDFTGMTPFIFAARAGDVAVMKMLLTAGADPKIETFAGTNALMAAAGVNWVFDQTYWEGEPANLAAVQLCFDLGLTDVNHQNSMGVTALMGAANRGSDTIIRYLASKGARLDIKDAEGRTAMTWAEGVFLATHPAKTKPSSITLLQELTKQPPQDKVASK
ncbi:MAG TPA: ankyrin repeat domain-containing protein [Vicinamibacterales bacterium]|jgi:ankyrin|nr:ankyrin repeat domain-containing protein [Vicinamibacterales bacterium]